MPLIPGIRLCGCLRRRLNVRAAFIARDVLVLRPRGSPKTFRRGDHRLWNGVAVSVCHRSAALQPRDKRHPRGATAGTSNPVNEHFGGAPLPPRRDRSDLLPACRAHSLHLDPSKWIFIGIEAAGFCNCHKLARLPSTISVARRSRRLAAGARAIEASYGPYHTDHSTCYRSEALDISK